MATGEAAAKDLEKLFQEWGLPVPPVPDRFRPELKEVREELFSTRSDGATTGDALWFVREALTDPVADYLSVGHAGRGAASQSIFYYLLYRPLVLTVRVGWLNAYDDDQTAPHARDVIRATGDLIHAVEGAVADGRLSRDELLVVVQSDFDDCMWQRFAPPIDPGAALAVEWHQSPDAIGAAMASLDDGPGTDGPGTDGPGTD